jgi:predicted dehydrogenase
MKPVNRRQFVQASGVAGAMSLPFASAEASAAGPGAESSAASAAAQIQPVGGQNVQVAGRQVPLAPPDQQPPNLQLPKVHEQKLGWAVVGLGQLALGQIMPAFGQCELSEPRALVSGHPDKARHVARAYGIDQDAIYNYDNYEKIASDDRIDVIYIALPNSMHAEFTVAALKAGKHVLCEKPMATSIADCQRMIETADEQDRRLMIAYRLHYEPFNRRVIEMCKQKRFGELKTFSGSFCIGVQAPNIRLSEKLGGGPVGDVGVYPINASRYVTGEEPVEVFAQAHQPNDDPRFREVPESVSCLLKFPSGVLANLDCSFGTHRSDFYRVACADGTIELSPAFSYNGQTLKTHQRSASSKKPIVVNHELTEVNHFASEMDHFSRCILNGDAPRTPGPEGLADMRILAAMDQSIRENQPVQVG